MGTLTHRVEKLESDEARTKAVRFLWQEPGESREDCIRRHGYRPDDKRATFVMTSWLDAEL